MMAKRDTPMPGSTMDPKFDPYHTGRSTEKGGSGVPSKSNGGK